ncbi:MAG: NACHT domain-containing protein, partial [Microcystaceae cyanobacterium]
ERVTLKLQDWFLPALYQAGHDGALFTPDPWSSPISGGEVGSEGNLPEVQEAGFWGRAGELWAIERAFVQGTRRITISGFGGMGKTYLAQEAGRWLWRTGMFTRVCFISFADFQGIDPVGYAVSVLANVLETNLLDGAAATRELAKQPVLVILDNLETLQPPQTSDTLQSPLFKGGRGDKPLAQTNQGDQPLTQTNRGDQPLLDLAKTWSETGQSRVLLTTRANDLQHPDYPRQGSRKHILVPLGGLAENDALDYFQSLIKLPPAPQFRLPHRTGLLELFAMLDYHP